MERFLQVETLIIELLVVASLVAIAVRRFRVPYTVALVVAGLFITMQHPVAFNVTSELILALFVPPLVFEAAFHLNLTDLRRNLTVILMLAVPGVIGSTLLVGGLLAWLTPLTWPLAIVFGALVAATDPVAVVALLRVVGVPKRLAVLIESESLLNDGTAIVIFNLALAAALTGQFNLLTGITDFLRVAAGGVLVGLGLGWVATQIIGRVDDYLIETTLTMILAFGSYLTAESLHVSGVLAVVIAGLVSGSLGLRNMSPTTRIGLVSFWEYAAFLANSLIFLLIGLQSNLPALVADRQPIAWAVVAILVSRVVVVYGLTGLVNLGLRRQPLAEPIPLNWQHVLNWGGLRGAISLALALSLPAALGPERFLLQTMTFGVVLFTLLAQGTTMETLVRRLKIMTRRTDRYEYERRHARLVAARAAEARLDELHRAGLLSTPTWEALTMDAGRRSQELAEAARAVLQDDSSLAIAEWETARRELWRVERSALTDLQREGVISEEVFENLITEIDARVGGRTAGETDHAGNGQRK